MAIKMIFGAGGSQVCAFVNKETGQPGPTPITIYPNAHDQFDSISIQWTKSVEEADKLANDILAAVAAVKSAAPAARPFPQDCPGGCGKPETACCCDDRGDER